MRKWTGLIVLLALPILIGWWYFVIGGYPKQCLRTYGWGGEHPDAQFEVWWGECFPPSP